MYAVTEQYSQSIAKAVRTTAVSGFIKTKGGEILPINDGSIKTGSLSISSRLNSSGDFKPGGVYSSELSVTFLGIAADGLDGARITLDFRLYRGNSGECDSVPLGTFYVDGSTIKRRGRAVSLKADDALMNFDYPAEAISGTLHELAVTACERCDVPLRTSTEEFLALPNADITAEVDTSRVQTWRDLLIFIAMLTGTFVRIDRTGGLCFVPLTCERDNGVIIPVREIAGAVRSSTEFSDDTTRITRLFMRRGGGVISAERNLSESSEVYAALELTENPLLTGLSDEDAQAALAKTLAALSVCLNRAYKTDFNGDPALETGDYVRLRGGAVDTSRGYATGMITSQVWRYRGNHTIQCSLSSSIPPEESVQAFALFAADDTAGTVSRMRVQPKSQLEKQLDAMRGKAGTGGTLSPITTYEYLYDPSVKLNGTTYTIEKNAAGLISKITDSLGNTLKPTISGEITDIALHNAALWGAVMARGIWSSRANPNMLDNSDFRINQRGQGSYTKAGYTVDRWKQESRTKVTMEPDGIRVECIRSTAEPWAGFAQIAEAPFVAGESYTVSVYVTDILGAWRLRSDNAADGVEINLTAGLNVLTFKAVRFNPGSFSNNGININITSETMAGDYFKLKWTKLEVGETATEYTAPDFADELRECQRFYQIHSSGNLGPDELDPPMRATPTVTRLADGNYAYSADL